MSFAIHVQGGTGAGCKQPLRAPGKPWFCDCHWANFKNEEPLPGYLTRCPDCGTRRP